MNLIKERFLKDQFLAVVGMQWGDEGKGKIVDAISEGYEVAVRFHGGNNAGHTVVIEDKVFKLSLLPVNILRKNKLSIIGTGTVIDPFYLIQEINNIRAQGIEINEHNLAISDNATVILPLHRQIDHLCENDIPHGIKIGTTYKGIGPAYADRASRRALRISDLASVEKMREKLLFLHAFYAPLLNNYNIEIEPLEETLKKLEYAYSELKSYIKTTWKIINDLADEGKRIIFEGAQGLMLDLDYGTHPFVTASNTLPAALHLGAGLPAKHPYKILGIAKAYTTRVGEGPFPTELKDDVGKKLQNIGNEFGTVTGRARRCGWFDACMVKYAARLSGTDTLCLTKLDVLSNFSTIKICVAYKDKITNQIYDYPPIADLDNMEPIYEELSGWDENIRDIKDFNKLPENTKIYLKAIEKYTNLKISLISLSPERSGIIEL